MLNLTTKVVDFVTKMNEEGSALAEFVSKASRVVAFLGSPAGEDWRNA